MIITVNEALGIPKKQHMKNMTGRIIDLKTELINNLFTPDYRAADTLKKIAAAKDATIEEKLVATFTFVMNLVRFRGDHS